MRALAGRNTTVRVHRRYRDSGNYHQSIAFPTARGLAIVFTGPDAFASELLGVSWERTDRDTHSGPLATASDPARESNFEANPGQPNRADAVQVATIERSAGKCVEKWNLLSSHKAARRVRLVMAGTAENERQLIGLLNLDDGFKAPRSGVWPARVDPEETLDFLISAP